MRTIRLGARASIPAALALAIALSPVASAPAAASTPVAADPILAPTDPILGPTDDGTIVPPPVDPPPVDPPPVDPPPVDPPPVAPAPTMTEAQQIIRIARNKIGDPWRYGADGPNKFDCSGLVRFAYKRADDGHAIRAARLRSASSLYHWFKAHGKASRHHPKIGDLVIWGGGTHVGIYIGKGKAISTLTRGVRVHRVFAVTARFTAFLHTGMSTKLAR